VRKGIAHAAQGVPNHRFAAAQGPAEHLHAIAQQATVGGIVDRRLRDGAVHPQFAARPHLGLLGQHHHPVIQCPQRRRPHELGPAQQRRVVGHPLEVHPAEPAQHQAVGHPLFGVLKAPAVEMLERQQPQDHLHRGRAAPPPQRLWVAPCQIALDLLEQRIVIQQLIECPQHRIGLGGQLGHAGKHILDGVAINQHRSLLSGPR